MSNLDIGGAKPKDNAPPTPVPIAPNAAIWIIIVGAFFGLVTLVGLFLFAYLSAIHPQLCSSFQFQLLAGGFALGAALAGGFIGGGAGAQGSAGGTGFNLIFGLTGGAALLVVTLAVFSVFAPKGCDVLGSEQMQIELKQLKSDLANTKSTLDQTSTDLSSALTQKATAEQQVSSLRDQLSVAQSNIKAMDANLAQSNDNLERIRASLDSVTTERNAATVANTAARAEVARLVTAIGNAFPGAPKLSADVGSIANIVSQDCSGGPNGIDGAHAGLIRSMSVDAAKRIAAAQAAISSIVTSVSAEFKN